jgi:hypothetical protein
MVMIPAGLGPQIDCAGEAHQQSKTTDSFLAREIAAHHMSLIPREAGNLTIG